MIPIIFFLFSVASAKDNFLILMSSKDKSIFKKICMNKCTFSPKVQYNSKMWEYLHSSGKCLL